MNNDLNINNIEVSLYELKGMIDQMNERIDGIIDYLDQFNELEENADI